MVFITIPTPHHPTNFQMEVLFSFPNYLHKAPKISTVKMSNENQRLLRDWRDNYGQPVRLVSVLNQSTRDNVGTLPLYSYTKPQPTPNPLLFAGPALPISRQDRRRSNGILYSAATVLAIKPSISGVAESVIPALFYLGVPAADIFQDQHMTDLPNTINLFVPSEQDTYMFVKKQQGNIPKEAVGLVLQTIQYSNDSNADEIVLPEKVFETTSSVFREARDENDCDDSAKNREDESDSDENCGSSTLGSSWSFF